MRASSMAMAVLMMGVLLTAASEVSAKSPKPLPVEEAQVTFTPDVPPPITRKKPALVRVRLDATVKVMPLDGEKTYAFLTFNDQVPGPSIRARVGDTLEVHIGSSDASGMPHNVDFHAVTGPGGRPWDE